MAVYIAGVVRHVSIRIQACCRKQGRTLEFVVEVGMVRELHQQVGYGLEGLIAHITGARTGNAHITQRQMCLRSFVYRWCSRARPFNRASSVTDAEMTTN